MYKKTREPDLSMYFTASPSVNGAYASINLKRVKSKKYREWLKLSAGELMAQKRFKVGGYISIAHTLFFSDCRARDVANYEKCMTDMLVNCNIIDDDSNVCQNIQQFGCFTEDLGRHMVRVDIFSLSTDEAKQFMSKRMLKSINKKR